jgi:hypothetical protein
MDKFISVTLFKDLFMIVPQSGNTDKVWFQEEASPEFYCNLDEGPERLGYQIRQAEFYSRDILSLGLKYPKGIMGMLSKRRKEKHQYVSKMTEIRLNQLHKFDHSMAIYYKDDQIILRFLKRAEDEKFNYRYINKDEADEPRLSRNSTDLELGQKIFDWANSLDLNT